MFEEFHISLYPDNRDIDNNYVKEILTKLNLGHVEIFQNNPGTSVVFLVCMGVCVYVCVYTRIFHFIEIHR